MSPPPIVMFVPVETPSLTNQREHWTVRKRRANAHRTETKLAWLAMHEHMPPFPLEVILTRVAPRALDDDNLRGALKSCRDEIAAICGVDDRDPRIMWRYGQERGNQVGVRVAIGEMPTVCLACGRRLGGG